MDLSELKKRDEGRWHPVPGSDAEVLIKEIRPSRMDQLTKMATKKKIAGRGVAGEVDQNKLNRFLLDEAVLNWKKIEMDGKALEVNQQNKIMVDGAWTEFRELWNGVVLRQVDEEVEAEEEDLKN